MPVLQSSSDAGWDLPKRYLRMTLYRGQTKDKIFNILTEDMHVRFNTAAAVSGALTEANITIGGLAVNTMFKLATSTTQWIKDWEQNRIVIDAGYYAPGGRHSVIFDGTIKSAKPNLDSADYTITINAITPFETITEPLSYTFPGTVSVATISQKLADDAGLVFVNGWGPDKPVPNINDFSAQQQNLTGILRMISAAVPVSLYIDMGRLILSQRGMSAYNMGTLTINTTDIIGIPEPTETGCIINVRMNPAARTGMSVSVKSEKYPQLNSYKFYLSVLNHVGDTFSRDWLTRLVLVKEGLGYYKNE